MLFLVVSIFEDVIGKFIKIKDRFQLSSKLLKIIINYIFKNTTCNNTKATIDVSTNVSVNVFFDITRISVPTFLLTIFLLQCYYFITKKYDACLVLFNTSNKKIFDCKKTVYSESVTKFCYNE